MPRWLFLTFVAALVLAVFGSALVALRGAPAKPPGPAASFSCGRTPCPAIAGAG